MAFPIYEVTVAGFPPIEYSAATPAKARAMAWGDYTHAYECTFKDFLKISTVRRCGVPEDDGYGYVRSAYGVDVAIGDRVTIVNEGSMSGRVGEVIYPGRRTAYVRLVLDGSDEPVNVHPMNIKTEFPQAAKEKCVG